MILYFGGPPRPRNLDEARGFESPLVHLLGLVYDAFCLLAFVVLLGRQYGVCQLGVPGQACKFACLATL